MTNIAHLDFAPVILGVSLVMVAIRVDGLQAPVLPNEVSAVAEQVLLGGSTQSQRPEVIQAHLGRAGFPRIATKQIMDLKRAFIYTHTQHADSPHAP